MSRILLAACALSLLAACGLRGDLERPAPMWGETRERYEQDATAARAEAEAEDEANAENDPGLGSTTSSIPVPR